jgi:hypothetical protein
MSLNDEEYEGFEEDWEDDRTEDEGLDARLSYLDLVTAAFSSAIFLLFIFASLPLDRAGGGGSPCFADLQFEYENEDAEVELILVHKYTEGDGTEILRTSDRNLDYDEASGLVDNTRGRAKAILLTNQRDTFEDANTRLGFRLLEPVEGTWEVYLNSVIVVSAFDAIGVQETRIKSDAIVFAPERGGCADTEFRADQSPILMRPDGDMTLLMRFEVES